MTVLWLFVYSEVSCEWLDMLGGEAAIMEEGGAVVVDRLIAAFSGDMPTSGGAPLPGRHNGL